MADNRSRYARLHESNEDGDNDVDPLVELARIVSEDGGFYRARPVQDVQRRSESKAFSTDLEAELYQEFELSVTPPARDQRRRGPEPAPERTKGAGRKDANKAGCQPAIVGRPAQSVVARQSAWNPVAMAARPSLLSRLGRDVAPQAAASSRRSGLVTPVQAAGETGWEDRPTGIDADATHIYASDEDVGYQDARERMGNGDPQDGSE